MLMVTRLIQSMTQMTMPMAISSSCFPNDLAGGRISSQKAIPHSGAM